LRTGHSGILWGLSLILDILALIGIRKLSIIINFSYIKGSLHAARRALIWHLEIDGFIKAGISIDEFSVSLGQCLATY